MLRPFLDGKTLVMILPIAVGLYLAENGFQYVNGWADVGMFVLFCGFMWLLFRESGSAKQAHTHEDPRQSVAFRFGKFLNSIRRRLRGSA